MKNLVDLNGCQYNAFKPNSKPLVILIERATSRKLLKGDCKKIRCLKNFGEFLRGLKRRLKLPITVFKPTTDFPSTLKLFPRAKVVIGVHGAGLQNVMFCKPNTTVIELGHTDFYGRLSRQMRLRYHSLKVPGISQRSRNTKIDVNKFVDEIDKIIQADFSLAHGWDMSLCQNAFSSVATKENACCQVSRLAIVMNWLHFQRDRWQYKARKRESCTGNWAGSY